ncbi:hypothetical protein G3N55_02005 [Dissulfurirhabdus thermomarina]|uniref:Uncharacterized protein n=1 Tax=Dissulfurirhabdus thermomarina TaxID=1765737 RepID=A0A6N9TSW3_DISTH|nr:hypothetical protein [Dissulfurirhabdus thermomarina]NDY41626.1 hypothetical protein [Dissulfurirhabdus thermomarina]NMX23331.1 hypothetical protein [Dissulfurirhabdus thermomarina]
MLDKKALCEKISQIYPDIGACQIDVDVEYDESKKAWVVHLEKDGKRLDTYLEPEEADACMLGKECVSLGLQVGQLVRDIKERPSTRQSEGV